MSIGKSHDTGEPVSEFHRQLLVVSSLHMLHIPWIQFRY